MVAEFETLPFFSKMTEYIYIQNIFRKFDHACSNNVCPQIVTITHAETRFFPKITGALYENFLWNQNSARGKHSLTTMTRDVQQAKIETDEVKEMRKKGEILFFLTNLAIYFYFQ